MFASVKLADMSEARRECSLEDFKIFIDNVKTLMSTRKFYAR